MAAPESPGETDASRRSPMRKSAVLLALRYYGRELSGHRAVALPGLLLPALGNICLLYLPPLMVAGLAGRVADDADDADTSVTTVLPGV